jgi:putative ABC transport system substrate-binding protein
MAGRAQQPALPVVGLLRSSPAAPVAHVVAAFRQGLMEAGFIEGQTVVSRNGGRTISRIGCRASSPI